VKPYKNVDAPRIRFIAIGQVKALIEAADPDFAPMIQAAIYTGCRWSELCRLRVHHVTPDQIHIAESKSGKTRDVPLSAEGKRFFTQQVENKPDDSFVFTVDGEPWGKSMQKRRMDVASDRAEIKPRVSFHLLRHFYASVLVEQGVSLQMVARLLGHSDTRVTEKHYAHLQPSTLADVVEKNLLVP
jgi:integrase